MRSYKNVSKLYQALSGIDQLWLSSDIIQNLNCDIDCYSSKFINKFVELIQLLLWGAFKWERMYKSWHVGLEPD